MNEKISLRPDAFTKHPCLTYPGAQGRGIKGKLCRSENPCPQYPDLSYSCKCLLKCPSQAPSSPVPRPHLVLHINYSTVMSSFSFLINKKSGVSKLLLSYLKQFKVLEKLDIQHSYKKQRKEILYLFLGNTQELNHFNRM